MWFRASELKHGRVARLATVGYMLGAAGITFPGDIAKGVSFASVNEGGVFNAWSSVPEAGKLQVLVSNHLTVAARAYSIQASMCVWKAAGGAVVIAGWVQWHQAELTLGAFGSREQGRSAWLGMFVHELCMSCVLHARAALPRSIAHQA